MWRFVFEPPDDEDTDTDIDNRDDDDQNHSDSNSVASEDRPVFGPHLPRGQKRPLILRDPDCHYHGIEASKPTEEEIRYMWAIHEDRLKDDARRAEENKRREQRRKEREERQRQEQQREGQQRDEQKRDDQQLQDQQRNEQQRNEQQRQTESALASMAGLEQGADVTPADFNTYVDIIDSMQSRPRGPVLDGSLTKLREICANIRDGNITDASEANRLIENVDDNIAAEADRRRLRGPSLLNDPLETEAYLDAVRERVARWNADVQVEAPTPRDLQLSRQQQRANNPGGPEMSRKERREEKKARQKEEKKERKKEAKEKKEAEEKKAWKKKVQERKAEGNKAVNGGN